GVTAAGPAYDPQKIEEKWQKRWAEAREFETEADPSKPKYYVLEMLPYPSGTMHMGHMRNYAIGDVVARVKRMSGFNVLHPMGWDAFGLPAENAAIKNNTHPREWTNKNIAEFQRVLRRFGFSYDWRREISTCEPEYYRWNQWFFLRMLERGLAYRKKSRVNWCPKCSTVLANEQVINGGYCWRHEDTLVESLLQGSAAQKDTAPQLAKMRQASVKAEDVATAEKEGFFTGRYATNPFNNEKLPIWVGNFVLMEYGTGAIMAVPAHDQRDF